MVLSFSAALNLLTLPFTSKHEPLIKKGSSGDYDYELWHGNENSGYYLKIWRNSTYSKGQTLQVVGSFTSAKEALDYLNSNYKVDA